MAIGGFRESPFVLENNKEGRRSGCFRDGTHKPIQKLPWLSSVCQSCKVDLRSVEFCRTAVLVLEDSNIHTSFRKYETASYLRFADVANPIKIFGDGLLLFQCQLIHGLPAVPVAGQRIQFRAKIYI